MSIAAAVAARSRPRRRLVPFATTHGRMRHLLVLVDGRPEGQMCAQRGAPDVVRTARLVRGTIRLGDCPNCAYSLRHRDAGYDLPTPRMVAAPDDE